jgi:uracil-DNA glycosylase
MNNRLENYLPTEWQTLLSKEIHAQYFKNLEAFLESENAQHTVYPPENKIFTAFNCVKPSDIKVVILGQDPYHGAGQAHGLAFSVQKGIKIPPSLVNIFKELKNDLNVEYPADGNLQQWAQQGVFLLNATLTVRANEAGSHQKKGWEQFTDAVIKTISDTSEHIVFILWGNYARAKVSLIDTHKHLILTAAHPSPLSAYNGFFGCKHFSQTNNYLIQNGKAPIDWSLNNFFN